MTFQAWLHRLFYDDPPVPPIKEDIKDEIEQELNRLDEATISLGKELDTVRRSRARMGDILEDAVRAMKKELRK